MRRTLTSPTELDAKFYGARAKGGVGLVITECLIVDELNGRGNNAQMSCDGDKYIPGLKKVADEVHKYGMKICGQIYHPGRQGIAVVNGVESMPSASQTECQCVHQPTHEMTQEEIDRVIGKFAQAARVLKDAGWDAVELHGAHGYMIGQFLSPYTNKRTDKYGGSFENRMRFLDEIIEAVRKEVGPDFPVLLRYSADEHMEYAGQPEDGLHTADGLEIGKYFESKVDALDVSAGIYETMNTAWEPVGFDQGWKIETPAAVKAAVKSIPVIGVGVIRDPAYAESLIAEGKVDMIGSARTFLADPEWGNKAREGREKEIRKCISCLYCMETLMSCDMTGEHMGCSINFEGLREDQYDLEKLPKDGNGRVVAVIGAGPAGMEAARVAATRGFKVVLFEKQGEVGGQIVLASKPPKKEKTYWLVEYLKNMMHVLGVEVRLNCAPTIEDLKALNPYAVIVSQGSVPVMPKSIPGLDGENVYTPVDILSGAVQLRDKNVGVIGSGMTGLEMSEMLADQGNKITLFEMMDDIGPGIFFQNMIDVMKRFMPHEPVLLPKHKLLKIEGTTATFEDMANEKEVSYDFDVIVVSLGTRSNTELAEEIKANFDKVTFVGDALKAGRIEPAIRTGYLAAAEL